MQLQPPQPAPAVTPKPTATEQEALPLNKNQSEPNKPNQTSQPAVPAKDDKADYRAPGTSVAQLWLMSEPSSLVDEGLLPQRVPPPGSPTESLRNVEPIAETIEEASDVLADVSEEAAQAVDAALIPQYIESTDPQIETKLSLIHI